MIGRHAKLVPPAPSSKAVSAVMRGNRGRDTKPELIVRKLLFAQGYRYRVHLKTLPGRPDIVFTKRKKIIFVHGCFWHQHPSEVCPLRSHPKSNTGYWTEKLKRNQERDQATERHLCELGWDVLTVWECETQNTEILIQRLRSFLGHTSAINNAVSLPNTLQSPDIRTERT